MISVPFVIKNTTCSKVLKSLIVRSINRAKIYLYIFRVNATDPTVYIYSDV